MLSSRKTRFQWSKQDRGGEVTLFRSMAQHWQPPVHRHDSEFDVEVKSSPAHTEPASPETPTWTPWLWVD
ncbi:hypothetical protein [Rhodoplanes roseus]|uniref:Uncharacterized protein n=1 Tax=Rhodoplanes roseus TaxID=29409 RepID=A0A327KL24_9BRAD|nr:hypothetical protein [Rhodoplanes roseus]RAI37972.1 hypothetical protein CH341_28715 [Rhodoplanes roseus]